MNKKSDIQISLSEMLALVLAAIVLVVILFFIQDILAFFIPGPSAITLANFNRLGDEITNLGDGNEIIVPYYMVPEDKIKLVSSNVVPNPNCHPSNCLCICSIGLNGCDKWKKSICFKGYEIVIEDSANLDIENYNKSINLLSIRKDSKKITIKDTAQVCPSGNICCSYYLSGYGTEENPAPVYIFKTNAECDSLKGDTAPCSFCK